ncbi:uncharacterized protein LOC128923084 [Zeugodacus cucurbitae]|uniref:uncharacterized protein LOC128923084 n=1 Tax=Zeugodacus cucurbitae TaxID=28588 RepID=UPI0023D946D7|nr:uncharacterized protein LOC128923084 [Zeugodacus cucurbitae]
MMSPSINAHSHIYWMSKLSWLLVFMLVFLHSATHGLPGFKLSDCILSNSDDPNDCKVGAFNINMNKPNCPPRLTCYRNFTESCHMYDDGNSNCLPPYVCDCHKCREVLTLCHEKVKSPLNLPKRMKPIYPEYIY